MRRRGPWRFLPFLFVGVFVFGDGGISPWVLGGALAFAVGLVAFALRGGRRREDGEAPRITADPLEREVAELTERLTLHGHARLAERLDAGLQQLAELRAFHERVGDLDAELRTARGEEQRLQERAHATADPEARGTWLESAQTAARRVAKLESLRDQWDRAAARIEAYTQLVKSIRVDLARLDATPGSPLELEDHASRLDREVDAMVRAREEVSRLERVGMTPR